MAKTAYLQIRTNMQYRNDVFRDGVTKLGYKWDLKPTQNPEPGDILIIWNRYSSLDKQACLFERLGLPVIVIENSYLDMHDCKKAFAMALNWHNGAGRRPKPDYERKHLLKVEIKPWKTKGKNILILPQRGIGVPPVAMPKTWTKMIERRISKWDRPYHLRLHPELLKKDTKGREKRILDQDLEHAWCAVCWASSAGLKALLAGVPTFTEFGSWIGLPTASYGIRPLRDLDQAKAYELMGDRQELLERVAWAQWSGEEVRTGGPIQRLIDLHYATKEPAK